MARDIPARISKELKSIIDRVRAEYVRRGKKPPSMGAITKEIARMIDEDALMYDGFISFK